MSVLVVVNIIIYQWLIYPFQIFREKRPDILIYCCIYLICVDISNHIFQVLLFQKFQRYSITIQKVLCPLRRKTMKIRPRIAKYHLIAYAPQLVMFTFHKHKWQFNRSVYNISKLKTIEVNTSPYPLTVINTKLSCHSTAKRLTHHANPVNIHNSEDAADGVIITNIVQIINKCFIVCRPSSQYPVKSFQFLQIDSCSILYLLISIKLKLAKLLNQHKLQVSKLGLFLLHQHTLVTLFDIGLLIGMVDTAYYKTIACQTLGYACIEIRHSKIKTRIEQNYWKFLSIYRDNRPCYRIRSAFLDFSNQFLVKSNCLK